MEGAKIMKVLIFGDFNKAEDENVKKSLSSVFTERIDSYYNASCENKRYSELQYKNVWNITWSSIWRDDSLTHATDIYSQYDYTFITGHVPVQRIRRYQEPSEDWNSLQSFRHRNLINIDGGCALGHTGEINNGTIFLRLDDMKEFPVPLE